MAPHDSHPRRLYRQQHTLASVLGLLALLALPACGLANSTTAPSASADFATWFDAHAASDSQLESSHGGRRLASPYAVYWGLSDGLSSGSTTSVSSITVTIGFASSSVTGLALDDFVTTGVVLSNLQGASGSNIYTLTADLYERAVSITLPQGSVDPDPHNAEATVTLTYGKSQATP